MQILVKSWAVLIVWSLASLFFYRSSEKHGPDVVGEEVFHFALPLLIALVVAIVASFMKPPPRLTRWSLLFATIALATLEAVSYSLFIVR